MRADLYNHNMPYEEIVFCEDYLKRSFLYYNEKQMGKFYLLDLKTYKTIQAFDSIEEFLNLYTEYELSILDEYDERPIKISNDPIIREKDKNLPDEYCL